MRRLAQSVVACTLLALAVPAAASIVQFDVFGVGPNVAVAQQNALANAVSQCDQRGGELVGFGGQVVPNGPGNVIFLGTAQCDVH